MKKTMYVLVALFVCLFLVASSVEAQQFTQVWKYAAGTWPMMTGGDNSRGMALNKVTNHLLVTRRDLPRIYVVNAATGALLDSLNVTGITGGAVPLQDIEVSSDGVIYASNLTTNSSTTAYKIYKWASENDAAVHGNNLPPALVYSGPSTSTYATLRLGDVLDVAGTGDGTVILASANAAVGVQKFLPVASAAKKDPAALKLDSIPFTDVITVDGDLTEAQWATNHQRLYFKAGATVPPTQYDNLVSGGFLVSADLGGPRAIYPDTSTATVKFLVQGKKLYIGVQSNDKQVCKFGDSWEGDGIFLKIQTAAGVDKEFKLYFNNDTIQTPVFEQPAAGWGVGAGKVISGKAHDSTDVDGGYTLEMLIYLDSLGYKTTPIAGTKIPFNICVFDPDNFNKGDLTWVFPPIKGQFYKAFWGSEWGNDRALSFYDLVLQPHIAIATNDAGAGIAQITPGGNFFTSRYSAGSPIRLYNNTGTRLDAVPATATSGVGPQADLAYLEAGGRKWLATAPESTAAKGRATLLNITYGLTGSVKVGSTPLLDTAANLNASGDVEMVYNAADSTMTLFVLVDNNGVGAYKTGNLLKANLNPNVSNVRRSPFIPLAGQGDTVLIDVMDDGYVTSVKAKYNVDGGADSVLTMTRISGDSIIGTYRAIIPGAVNSNGKRISHYFEVTDNAAAFTKTTASGYFAGTTKLTLTGPRAVDTIGVLLYKGYGIRVTGICVFEDSITYNYQLDAYVQDEAGGADIFQNPIKDNLIRFNSYTIEGVLDQYRGKMEITVPAGWTKMNITDNGPAVPPKPKLVTVKDLTWANKGELLENTIVSVAHLKLTASSLPWPAWGASGTNVTVTDNGVDSMTLRVPQWSNLNGYTISQPFTITGVANQFNSTSAAPFKDGYQVIPRDIGDFAAEVNTWLKDTTRGEFDAVASVPLSVQKITGLGITSYQFNVKWDTLIAAFVSATNKSTISDGWTFTYNLVKKGEANIAAASTVALKDSGVLFNLNFKVIAIGKGAITATGQFNEGSPVASVAPGVFIGGNQREAEPNDSLQIANPLTLGILKEGAVTKTTGDPDWYLFVAPVGHIVIDVTNPENTTDVDIYLHDSAGVILYNIDRNTGDRLEFNLPYAGKYYLVVNGYNDGTAYATGPYVVNARMDKPTDPNEPNDGFLFGFNAITTPVQFNMVDTTNTLDPGVLPGNDYDYFKLAATAGQTITATVKTKTFKSTSTVNGYQIRLYKEGSTSNLKSVAITDGSDGTLSYPVTAAANYFVRVINTVATESGPLARYRLAIAPPTGVMEDEALPTVFALEQNYPNPFNPATTIKYALPKDASVNLVVYDLLGREVRSLINEDMKAGYHEVIWDGHNNFGTQVASGFYIYRIKAGDFVSTKKMMLLK